MGKQVRKEQGRCLGGLRGAGLQVAFPDVATAPTIFGTFGTFGTFRLPAWMCLSRARNAREWNVSPGSRAPPGPASQGQILEFPQLVSLWLSLCLSPTFLVDESETTEPRVVCSSVHLRSCPPHQSMARCPQTSRRPRAANNRHEGCIGQDLLRADASPWNTSQASPRAASPPNTATLPKHPFRAFSECFQDFLFAVQGGWRTLLAAA